MKKYVIIVCLVFSLPGFSQNLTGTWLGVGNDYKIVLVQIGDSCFGYTYDTGSGYCKANFVGTYTDSTKKLKGTNTSFIARSVLHSLSSYRFNYSKEGGAEYLRGTASAKRLLGKIFSFGLGMQLSYRKLSGDIDTTPLIAAKLNRETFVKEMIEDTSFFTGTGIVADTPAVYSLKENELRLQKERRRSDIVNTIVTGADSLRLTLHDNGEIDNDTVTVFLNGKVIINRLGLTAKAYETFIPLTGKDSVYSIELMANNLGTIPPNTAYLTIWAGKEKYELRVSSDYSVNARIDIRYAPGE